MQRSRGRPIPQSLPDDLYDYADEPAPSSRRPRRGPSVDSAGSRPLTVIDDWPEQVPVTEAEIDVFERYFGDVLDRLFGPVGCKPESGGLRELSSDDNSKP